MIKNTNAIPSANIYCFYQYASLDFESDLQPTNLGLNSAWRRLCSPLGVPPDNDDDESTLDGSIMSVLRPFVCPFERLLPTCERYI